MVQREWGVAAAQTEEGLHFKMGRNGYDVLLVPSAAESKPWPSPSAGDTATRIVLLNNATDMEMPGDALCFDFATLQTQFNDDPVHTALRTFMLRYFGVRFTDSRPRS